MSHSYHVDPLDSELAELQRRFRALEGDRKLYAEESQNTLRKQRLALEKLKKENEYLKEELSQVEAQNEERSVTQSTTLNIANLQEQINQIQKQIEKEKVKLDDYLKREAELKEKIVSQKIDTGGVHAKRDENVSIQRQIRILEDRLDYALVKFNAAMTNNHNLRSQIDTLRKERVNFESVYRKLEKQLMDKKKEIAEIIEISNAAYELRDETQNKIIQLKEKAEREIALFEAEVRELNRAIEQDRKMKDFMRLKEVGGKQGSEDKKARKLKSLWNFENPQAIIQIAEEHITSFELGFAKLQATAGISDIEDFVANFIRIEEQNYSIFTSVNELNSEIDKMEEQIAETKHEIEKFKSQGTNTDMQRKKILRELDERLHKTDTKAEQYEVKYHNVMKMIASLKAAIEATFSKIGCTDMPKLEESEGSDTTESHIIQCLGLMEQRTNEIMQLHSALLLYQSEPNTVPMSLNSLSQTPIPTLTTPCMQFTSPNPTPIPNPHPSSASLIMNVSANLPSTNDEPDSDDDILDSDEEVPFSVEELKSRTMRKISKQDGTSRTKKAKTRKGDLVSPNIVALKMRASKRPNSTASTDESGQTEK